MYDKCLLTGKIYTRTPSQGNGEPKKLYIKLFLGTFYFRPVRLKQIKTYSGELYIKYSGREWPEKKNGPLLGDVGLLDGIKTLLSELELINYKDLKYSKIQHDIKETITLSVGAKLAKEMVDRGLVQITDLPILENIPNSKLKQVD